MLFGRVLRAAGLEIHPGRVVDALRALDWVGVRSRIDTRATLRSLLVHRHEDMNTFDRAFGLFFRAHRAPGPGLPLFALGERPRVVARARPGARVPVEFDQVDGGESSDTNRAAGAWSPHAVSRTRDFAEFTDAELAGARAILERFPWKLGVRRTRRWRRAAEGAVDLRPLLRRNLMRGGDLLELPRRRRREAARPMVLIADVSGSMERYSRVMLHFLYGLANSGTRVEAFVFATRLTRVTRELVRSRGADAIAAVAREVRDWGGGTRIGDALRSFNTRWARRVMRNGPIVVLVSDGWDRGDPDVLSRELARIRRSCRRVIWLNPLLGSPRYEPLSRGMQAALRHVDDFLPVHNLASIDQLVKRLQVAPARRQSTGGRPTAGGSTADCQPC
jgi:uncharacterized protein with von Willebrand factor type A (vWA) domain